MEKRKIFWPNVRIAKKHEKSRFIKYLVPKKTSRRKRKRKTRSKKRAAATKKSVAPVKIRAEKLKGRRKSAEKASLVHNTFIENSPPLKRRRRSKNFSSRKRNGTIACNSNRSSLQRSRQSGCSQSETRPPSLCASDLTITPSLCASDRQSFDLNLATSDIAITPRRKDEKVALNQFDTPDAVAVALSETLLKQNLRNRNLPISTGRRNRQSIEIKISPPHNSKSSILAYSQDSSSCNQSTNEFKFKPPSTSRVSENVKKRRSPQHIKPIFIAPLSQTISNLPTIPDSPPEKLIPKVRVKSKSVKTGKSRTSIRRIKPQFLGSIPSSEIKNTSQSKKKY